MTYQETTGACSSGEHLHIQTKVNGTVVNPWEVLTKGSSSGGFGCNIGSCPVD
jgi:murein DD-endopeptidase MepM/ murein hydrolase activator NlpD